MKTFEQVGLILIIVTARTFSSCEKTDKSKNEGLTQAENVWVNFMTQLESGNIDFLIKNSLDTIQCVDCEVTSDRQTEFYVADFIFKNRLDKLKHLKSLKDKEFSIHMVDNLIRVNYSFPATISQDHGYNLIFTFVKVDNKYMFTGMIVT
jgi:hypothetical protein